MRLTSRRLCTLPEELAICVHAECHSRRFGWIEDGREDVKLAVFCSRIELDPGVGQHSDAVAVYFTIDHELGAGRGIIDAGGYPACWQCAFVEIAHPIHRDVIRAGSSPR